MANKIPLGNRMIDPTKDNPYVAWVEEKEVTKGEKRNFIKCLLNAGGYGLTVELNRKRFGKNNPKKIRIWAGEKELPSITSTQFEEPGEWYFPWVGSLITGGGRLLLGILEKEVLTLVLAGRMNKQIAATSCRAASPGPSLTSSPCPSRSI